MASVAGIPVTGADAFGAGLQRGIDIQRELFVDPQRRAAADKRAQEAHDLQMQEGAQRISASQQNQARQNDAEALKLSSDQLSTIQQNHDALIDNYGGWQNVPQQEASKIGAQYRSWQDKHGQLLERARKRIDGWVSDGQTAQRDLAAGKNVDSKQLVNAIAVQTGINPKAFLDGPNGEPSEIRQAQASIARAGATGNWNEVVPAANTLLQAELRQGVGTIGKDGTPIISKEIVGFIPAQQQGEGPDAGGEVFPVLRVKTRGHPDGYTAPVTKDRTSDPDDPPITISVGKLIDRLQHVGTLVETLNHPGVRGDIEKGLKETGDELDSNLQAWAQLPPSKFQQQKTLEGIKATGRENVALIRGDTATNVAGITAGSREAVAETAAASRENVAGIRNEGGIARETIRQNATSSRAANSEAGKNARAANAPAGRSGAAQKLTQAQQGAMVEGEARKNGIFKTKDGWRQWKATGEGKGYYTELSPESNDKLAEIKDRIARSASPTAPGSAGIPTGSAGGPPANLLKEGVKTTFKNGQTWTLKNGQPAQVQ